MDDSWLSLLIIIVVWCSGWQMDEQETTEAAIRDDVNVEIFLIKNIVDERIYFHGRCIRQVKMWDNQTQTDESY